MLFHKFSHPIEYLDYLNFQERSRKKKRESILFLEHPSTITAGSSAKSENLLISPELLEKENITYLSVARGGDHTGHEEGQLVVYFHIDLIARGMKLGDFLREIQESAKLGILKVWGISVQENRESPGLYWSEKPSKKILSLGVYFKSFFTSYGFALNLSNSGKIFNFINPCGMKAEDMISIAELGSDPLGREEFIRFIADYWMNILTKKYPAKNGKTLRWI
jgi:lipoyl(octanoyl) transferase